MSGKKGPRKPDYEKVVRMNISLPPRLHQAVPDVVRRLGFTSASAYFQDHLRKDAGLNVAA